MPIQIKSLNQLRRLRSLLLEIRRRWLVRIVGIDVAPGTSLSLSSRFRPSRRGSIVIGPETLVAFKVLIYTFDSLTREHRPVRIGRRCFVGGRSTILPGVTIGDESIVGAGSVVFEDVPPRCIVVGNPARVMRRDIRVGPFGRLEGADEATRRMYYR